MSRTLNRVRRKWENSVVTRVSRALRPSQAEPPRPSGRRGKAATGHTDRQASSVALVQSALPGYRQGVMTALAEDLGSTLHVYSGECQFESTVRLGVDLGDRLTRVHNSYLGGRRLLWQHGVFRAGVGADTAILELNPRILSVWAISLCRRLRRRPTVLWGHAWPRVGRESWTRGLRRPLWALADVILAYTANDAEDLRVASGKPVVAAPNALYAFADAGNGSWTGGKAAGFIFVGRLVAAKKPALLIRAFALAAPELGQSSRLILVGDGPLRKQLQGLSQELGLQDAVEFRGALSRPADLKPLYESSLASVSPGYAGLSLTQSLWFGVPMVIARNEPHAPEISVAVDGENSLFVESDSVDHLAAGLLRVVAEREHWIARRSSIATHCAAEYSVEAMASGFLAAIDLARKRRPASGVSTASSLGSRRSDPGRSSSEGG